MALSTILVGGLPSTTNAFTIDHKAVDTEPNNSKETAQGLLLDPSYDYVKQPLSEISGRIDSLQDEDWFEVVLPEKRGHFRQYLFPILGGVPPYQLFGTRLDGTFGVLHEKDLSALSGKKIFIRVKAEYESEVTDYKYHFYYGLNPLNTDDVHEPNDQLYFDGVGNEFSFIEPGKLVNSKWNTVFDNIDNFAIKTNSNKGKLSFKVQYPTDEFEHWGKNKIDHYLTYALYAGKKDGTFTSVWGKAQIGMPNQTFSHSVDVNNADYSGTFVLMLDSNYKVNPNYQVSMNFESAVEPAPEPPVTEPTPPPAEPEPTPEPQPEPQPEPTEPQPEPVKLLERLSGDTRYSTNILLNSKIPSGTLDSVLIADGRNFPDALAGGVLNNTLNGTIILVNNNTEVIQGAIAETKRLLKPTGKVYVLGGTGVVSSMTENEFKKHFTVSRISGKDRIATAIEVAKKANPNPSEAFIAYGYDFADALSVVPVATNKKAPILLTNKNTLDSRVLEYLKNHNIQKVTIVGGTGVVSSNIESTLKDMKIQVERVSGSTRYTTALAIAEKYFTDSTSSGIASGTSFPDALSGSRFAFDKKMPILLVKSNSIEEPVKAFLLKRNSKYIYGGTGVVSSNIANLFK